MMSEAPGPLNFTMFLTLFGEKLTGQLRGAKVVAKAGAAKWRLVTDKTVK